VFGYGTDQALLRFEREFPKNRTPIAVLGFITVSIARNINGDRKFRTGIPLTKPRFEFYVGDLRLINNPIRTVAELAQLQDRYRGEEPQLRFPYSLNFFKSGFWVQLLASRHALGESEELWNNTTAVDLQFGLFERFHASATSYGAIPVILHLPVW